MRLKGGLLDLLLVLWALINDVTWSPYMHPNPFFCSWPPTGHDSHNRFSTIAVLLIRVLIE
jgi:hypothetical protein